MVTQMATATGRQLKILSQLGRPAVEKADAPWPSEWWRTWPKTDPRPNLNSTGSVSCTPCDVDSRLYSCRSTATDRPDQVLSTPRKTGCHNAT